MQVLRRRCSSTRWSIQSWVNSHFSMKIWLFCKMAPSIWLVVDRTSCRFFSASTSILLIWVPWALHSTSTSSTYGKGLVNVPNTLIILSYPVFQLHNVGEGTEVHNCRMSNCLGYLVKMIIGTGPVQDPHSEQAKENWIIDVSPIHLLKPFHPSNHIGPKPIIKEEVWIYVPPPSIMDNSLVVQLSWFSNTMEGVLGNLKFSVSVSIKRK